MAEKTGMQKLNAAIKELKKKFGEGVTVDTLGYLVDEFKDAANTLKEEEEAEEAEAPAAPVVENKGVQTPPPPPPPKPAAKPAAAENKTVDPAATDAATDTVNQKAADTANKTTATPEAGKGKAADNAGK